MVTGADADALRNSAAWMVCVPSASVQLVATRTG